MCIGMSNSRPRLKRSVAYLLGTLFLAFGSRGHSQQFQPGTREEREPNACHCQSRPNTNTYIVTFDCYSYKGHKWNEQFVRETHNSPRPTNPFSYSNPKETCMVNARQTFEEYRNMTVKQQVDDFGDKLKDAMNALSGAGFNSSPSTTEPTTPPANTVIEVPEDPIYIASAQRSIEGNSFEVETLRKYEPKKIEYKTKIAEQIADSATSFFGQFQNVPKESGDAVQQAVSGAISEQWNSYEIDWRKYSLFVATFELPDKSELNLIGACSPRFAAIARGEGGLLSFLSNKTVLSSYFVWLGAPSDANALGDKFKNRQNFDHLVGAYKILPSVVFKSEKSPCKDEQPGNFSQYDSEVKTMINTRYSFTK